ncbi:MAG: enoyl-CoA hydratase [Pseudomonadota bacterium]
MSTATASPQSDPLVLRHQDQGIAHLVLNRPTAYNALSLDLMGQLLDNLATIAQDRAVKAVIIRGNGKGFCAGHDLKEIRSGDGRPFFEQVFDLCSRLMTAVVRLPQPVIAQVHGIATAAGCQLVASCDLAIAAETTRFATPGVNIGLFCSTPMVALSRAVGRKRAMEMLLTGEMISAADAVQAGLINRAVPLDQLDAAVLELAGKITSKSPLTLRIGKEAFYRQIELDLDSAYRYASEVMVTNMLARDAEEGVDAFLEKRQPQWEDQ